jgi:hypothetical protein
MNPFIINGGIIGGSSIIFLIILAIIAKFCEISKKK